jgi:hypothetical protein
MKTAKEKAIELYSKMYGETPVRAVIAEIEEDKQCAKQCALIAVDEIDLVLQKSTPNDDPYANLSSLEYWQKVKREIEKL